MTSRTMRVALVAAIAMAVSACGGGPSGNGGPRGGSSTAQVIGRSGGTISNGRVRLTARARSDDGNAHDERLVENERSGSGDVEHSGCGAVERSGCGDAEHDLGVEAENEPEPAREAEGGGTSG